MVKTNEAQLRLLVVTESTDTTEATKRKEKTERPTSRATRATSKGGRRADRRSDAERSHRVRDPEVGTVRLRKMAPALIAKHCNVLLAEIDRVAPRQAWDHEARANHLAQLFAAAERVSEAQSLDERTKASA